MSIKDDIEDVLAGTGHVLGGTRGNSFASFKDDTKNVLAGAGRDSSTSV